VKILPSPKYAPVIMGLTTVEACEHFARNATERKDLMKQALARAAELTAHTRREAINANASGMLCDTEPEHDAWRALFAYEAALADKHDRKVLATYTRRSISKRGIIRAVERTVVNGTDETKGFALMADLGLLDLCFEATVLRFPDSYSAEAVVIAEERLKRHRP